MHDAIDPATSPVEDSRASSPVDMDIEASDDEFAPSNGVDAFPSTPAPHAHHPPMVYSPYAPTARPEGKEDTAVHPPMLPADVACEMTARKAELQIAAVLEGVSAFPPPSLHRPTPLAVRVPLTPAHALAEDAQARRRRAYATSSAARSRLRRYNPDYLLAARRWRASASPTTLRSPRKPVLGPIYSRSPSLDVWPHDLDLDASLETSTLVDPASPSPFMKHIPAYAPCETAADASGADWETRLLVHRASLANLRRAAVDAERSWAQVEALLRPVGARRGGLEPSCVN